MLKTILSIVLFVLAIGVSVFAVFLKKEGEKYTVSAVLSLALAVAFVAICTFVVVPPGNSGVLVTMGKVSETVIPSGAHFKFPFAQSIVNIDNRVQRTDVSGGGASKDLQTVTASLSVNYHTISTDVAKLYSEVGRDWDTVVVRPAVQECMKSVMATFTAEELITKRQSVGDLMQKSLAESVSKYGLSVDSINILNMDFSPEFNAAIEAKQTAQQSALKAEQDLVRIHVEAEQKVVEAQADADANRIRSESITQNILTSEYIKKWDGKMPLVTSDGESILDVSSMIEK